MKLHEIKRMLRDFQSLKDTFHRELCSRLDGICYPGNLPQRCVHIHNCWNDDFEMMCMGEQEGYTLLCVNYEVGKGEKVGTKV